MRDRGEAGGLGADGARGRRRRSWLAVGLAGLALVAVDLVRPPGSQVTTRVLLAGIDLYQATVSPWLGRAGAQCRFDPTCSVYGEAVIRRHGALGGGARAAWRILRCGPWTPLGTEDPPAPDGEEQARAGRPAAGAVLSPPRPVC